MHTQALLALLLGSMTAVTHAHATGPRASPLPQAKYGEAHGGDSKQLSENGWWHWSPGSGGLPGWNPSPHGKCKQIQHVFPPGTNGPGSQNYQRAQAVKKFYSDAFKQYAKYAFGKDTFDPVHKNGTKGGFGGWGAIIIDGIDTAVAMGLKDIVDQQLAWISKQDFTTSTDPRVDGFDTTIRLIAGLLGAYDLINSGKVPHARDYNRDHVRYLLTGATDLADFISPLFDSPTGLPYFWVDSKTKAVSGGINTAVAGTIILEYHRLSDLTGDDKYRQQADKAEAYLINPKPAPIFPGLVGSGIDVQTGEFTSQDAGWHSEIDSFLEYLIKSVVYDPEQEYASAYQDFWTTAVDSTIKHLAVHPYGVDKVTWIGQLNNTGSPLYAMDDYSTFAGGNFLLGGKYLGREDYYQLGLAFTDSINGLFNSTTAGLNPLAIAWYGPDNLAANPAYNGDSATARAARAYYNAKDQGYFPDTDQDPSAVINAMFPEPVESIFYAYRITGDSKWQEYNWRIFESLRNDTDRNGIVASSLNNVTEPYGGGPQDDLPSYFFAELLKYMYLSFSEPDLVSLDDFQFNTECHPFRVQGGTCSTPTRPGRGIIGKQ